MLTNAGKTSRVWAVVVAAMIAAVSVGSLGIADSQDAWMTDFDAAKKKAAAEKKDILVDFSGSDWCGWCIKLDKEVFSQESFPKEASKNFVLVVLDFPQKPENKAKIPQEQQDRNAKLQKEFGVQGFPTVFLTDAQGRPYAQTGYREGGPENYLKELGEFRAAKQMRDAISAKLENAEIKGLARAKLLDEFLQATPKDIADRFNRGEMAEIIRLDANNEAGLKSKYNMRLRMNEAQSALDGQDYKKAIELYQAILDELKPAGQELQDVWFSKGAAHFSLKDKPGMRKCLDEALKAAPNGEKADMIRANLKRFFPESQEGTAGGAVEKK